MGRPRIHKNEAARMEAFRAKNFRMDLVLPVETGNTIKEIAEQYNTIPIDVVRDLLRFALTNRNWKVSGLLPKAK